LRPFHFSFLVHDLDAARKFYGGMLGCKEGRSAPTWVDFNFFGHQISIHSTDDVPVSRHTGKVDDTDVPMPHFGAILGWLEFQALAKRAEDAKADFVIRPMLRFEGKPAEQATMFMRDPSGNALEFKAFRNEANIFSK
jgi:uncharacterized protein